MRNFFKACRDSISTGVRQPRVLVPFLLLALLEGGFLFLLYLFPQYPVSKVLAPPIRKFFGENYLHYPMNLLILPQLFNYASILLIIFPGILLNALVIRFLEDSVSGVKRSFGNHFKLCFQKIAPITLFWIISFYTNKYTYILSIKYFHEFLVPERFSILGSYFLSFMVQLLFLYALPLILLEQKKFFSALIGNFKVLWKLFFPTLILFFSAASIFFPVFYLKVKTPVYMGRYFPEIVIFILSFEIITIFFLNYFVTAISTHLFLNERARADQ